MDLLNQLIDSSQISAITAFVLGLLTALSPCTIATNVTAVAYVSRQVDSGGSAFRQGVAYTLGRVLAYTILGAVLIYTIRSGADTFALQQVVSEWGEWTLGPALLLVGLFMLVGHLLPIGKFGLGGVTDDFGRRGLWGAFLLGILFSMTFCPTSGLFYFGMLIPMSVEATSGYLLPLVFAIGTSLPVLLVSWLLAFSMQNLNRFVGGLQHFHKWFNRVVAALFIVMGCYYTIMVFI